jgi:hypothetical protein
MANDLLYGMHDLNSVRDAVITPADIPTVTVAIERTLAFYSEDYDTVWGLLAERTTDDRTKYVQMTGRHRLQPLDQMGRARPVQAQKTDYTVGWPLLRGGTAWGRNYEASLKMTVQQVNDLLAFHIDADITWNADQILHSLFWGANWTAEDEEVDDIPVKALANADGQLYYVTGQATPTIDETHYDAQLAAISDAADPFVDDANKLRHHPENGGEIIAFINSAQRSSVQGLTNFYTRNNPRIQRGANTDLLLADLGVQVPGTLLGYHDEADTWIVEWHRIPAGYKVTIATEGPRPLRFREDEVAALRGFRAVADRNDFPYFERQYQRKGGYGAWNRVGAHVRRIGNGTYAPPTLYNVTPPLY